MQHLTSHTPRPLLTEVDRFSVGVGSDGSRNGRPVMDWCLEGEVFFVDETHSDVVHRPHGSMESEAARRVTCGGSWTLIAAVMTWPRALVLLGLCSGCSPDEVALRQGLTEQEGHTYYRDVKPIVDRECVSCHSDAGTAPFALDTYDLVTTFAPMAHDALRAGIMPPMPANDADCHPIDDPRKMEDADRDLVIAWLEGDMAMGDPADEPESQEEADPLGPPDLVYGIAAPFVGEPETLDEHQCLVVDLALTEDLHYHAIQLVPSNAQRLHHAFLYLQPPMLSEWVDGLEAEEPDQGYRCIDSPGYKPAIMLGSYVPGSKVNPAPGGATRTLLAGSRIIVSAHYNNLVSSAPDDPTVEIWSVDQPSDVDGFPIFLEITEFSIPSGEPAFSLSTVEPIVSWASGVYGPDVGRSGAVWGAGAHMHYLGSAFRIEVEHQDGSKDCLLNIDRWDMDWQGSYRFAEPYDLVEGDQLHMTCVWDNSAENQPIIDGVQQEVSDVPWGADSFDEMCLGTLSMTHVPSDD